MEVYKKIQEVFSKSSELKNVVNSRFYSIAAKDDEDLPYIVSSAVEKPITKDGLMETQLQIACYGIGYDECVIIAQKVQELLENESGFIFKGAGDGKEGEKFKKILTYKVN